MEQEFKNVGSMSEALTTRETAEKPVCCCCGATVGTFTWIGGDDYKCASCRRLRIIGKPTFPFTTDNLVLGQKIEVQSIQHLRRLESQYGVQSAAYNLDEKNFDRG